MAKPNFETICTTTNTKDIRHWPNAAVVKFHYFNPNGVYAAKRAVDDQISNAVTAGLINSGCLFVYGSLNYYHTDKLAKLVKMKRVSSFDTKYHVKAIYDDIGKATTFLAIVKAWQNLGNVHDSNAAMYAGMESTIALDNARRAIEARESN